MRLLRPTKISFLGAEEGLVHFEQSEKPRLAKGERRDFLRAQNREFFDKEPNCSLSCVPKKVNRKKGSPDFAIDPSASIGKLRTTLFLGEYWPFRNSLPRHGGVGQFLLSLSKKRMDMNRSSQRHFKKSRLSKGDLPFDSINQLAD